MPEIEILKRNERLAAKLMSLIAFMVYCVLLVMVMTFDHVSNGWKITGACLGTIGYFALLIAYSEVPPEEHTEK